MKPVLEDFESTKPKLKNNAVPNVFSFSAPAKHRELSKARASKAEHHAVMDPK